MAGCLRSAVPLALRSNLIGTIGRLPGLFEKLLKRLQESFQGGVFGHGIERLATFVKIFYVFEGHAQCMQAPFKIRRRRYMDMFVQLQGL